MVDLTLNSHSIALADLSAGNFPPTLSDYEQRALDFCRAWLTGQETFIIQTSGSTGTPKSITLTRQQMVASARQTGAALGLRAGDRALVPLSVDYIAGRMMVVRGLELGLPLTIIDPVSRPLAQFSAGPGFEFTAMVPLQLQETLAGSSAELTLLNGMRAILIGGAPVSVALKAQLQPVSAPIYHTYGMTETVTHIALKRLNGTERSDFFVPFAGVDLGVDERGCLTICAAMTRGETLITNDLVDLQPDGRFRWLGRVDNIINSGGVKVQVEKVERAIERFLHQHQGGIYAGRRFFVGPLDHPRYGQAVVAVIEGVAIGVGEEPAAEVGQALQAGVRAWLNRYEVPRAVHFVAQLLETPTGKIDRLANLARLTGQARISKEVC